MNLQPHAVCVAVNNNDRAWYEMLIPFVLSLRQTGFTGLVAVIGYGLSDIKKAILFNQSIFVIEAQVQDDLPVGRFLEVARFCEANPEIEKVALYDADIWFCGQRFDVFEHILDDRLHVCLDAMFCSFIVAPLRGPQREILWHEVIDQVRARCGGALQAGLVAGSAAAWRAFATHVGACLDRIGVDFDTCFGLDTTFLHLWAAHEEVNILDPVYNFVAKLGLVEEYEEKTGRTKLQFQGRDVNGLHMTGDIRFLDRWRYYSHFRQSALIEGAPFALDAASLTDGESNSDHIETSLLNTLVLPGLSVVSVARESTAGAWLSTLATPNETLILGCGNHEIVLHIERDIAQLHIYMSHLSGFPSPVDCTIVTGRAPDATLSRRSNGLCTHYWIKGERGSEIVLRSKSLPAQLCSTVWQISEHAHMHQ